MVTFVWFRKPKLIAPNSTAYEGCLSAQVLGLSSLGDQFASICFARLPAHRFGGRDHEGPSQNLLFQNFRCWNCCNLWVRIRVRPQAICRFLYIFPLNNHPFTGKPRTAQPPFVFGAATQSRQVPNGKSSSGCSARPRTWTRSGPSTWRRGQSLLKSGTLFGMVKGNQKGQAISGVPILRNIKIGPIGTHCFQLFLPYQSLRTWPGCRATWASRPQTVHFEHIYLPFHQQPCRDPPAPEKHPNS